MKQSIAIAMLALMVLGPAALAAESGTKTLPATPPADTRVDRNLDGRKDSWQRFEPPRPFYRDRSERVWKPTTGDIKLRRAGD